MVNTKEKQTKVVNPAESSYRVKKMVIMALIAAMAYVIVLVCRIPIIPAAPYLDLEFKSAIILIGAYIFGPLSGLIMSVVICLVCPASFVYKKKKTTSGAIVGIIIGAVLMTVAMLLWNYILTPIYQGIPREAIVEMLLPVFVPFNLIKAGLNGGIALFIFRFAIEALQKANLIPKQTFEEKSKKNSIIGAVVVAGIIILTCVLVILIINGVF